MKTVYKYIIGFIFLSSIQVLFLPGIVSQILIKNNDLYNHDYDCDAATDTRFGDQVAMGDINHDGYSDIVVSSSKFRSMNKLSVFFGSVTGEIGELSLEAEITYYSTRSITMADMNGDDYMDLITGTGGDVEIYYGVSDKRAFGSSSYRINVSEGSSVVKVASAGDYNHDGIDDVIAEVLADNKTVVVYGFSSSKGIAEKPPQIVSPIEYRRAKGNLGDINADGYNDIIYKVNNKEVAIALGPGNDYLSWTVQGNDPGSSSQFGNACGSAGDINGDGYTDIFIGDALYNPTPENTTHLGYWGRVYIWFGGPASSADPTGFGTNPTLAQADYFLSGDYIAGSFGEAVAYGDINGDQYSDIAIGDPRGAGRCTNDQVNITEWVETGRVCLYLSGLAPPDNDNDGIINTIDNCPNIPNSNQENADEDKYGDACDNCEQVKNDQQDDSDNDGMGDACDECTRDALNDIDGDGYCAGTGYMEPKIGDQDNCPDISNPNQEDTDNDGLGDICDDDDDNDGIPDVTDNCPKVANTSQADLNSNRKGDACDDIDGDGYLDVVDNCPLMANTDQTDIDGDGIGDICDNCMSIKNIHQVDSDNDGKGDACDECTWDALNDIDGDGYCAGTGYMGPKIGDQDNCPSIFNPGQEDTDEDGIGDACNQAIDNDGDGWANNIDNCPNMPNADQKDLNNNGIGDICEYDLKCIHVEVTQAIQDENNSVPLVQGKDTWIRLHFDVGKAQDTLRPVSGKIKFEYENGKPMMILENNKPRSSNILYAQNFIEALPKADIDLLKRKHTLNFEIPGNWKFDGSPYLNIEVDYNGPDINPDNNSPQRMKIDFHYVKLNLHFIPIYGCQKVHHDLYGYCNSPERSDFVHAVQWVRRVYPISRVNAIYSSPIYYKKDPTKNVLSGFKLLNKIARINRFTNDPRDNTLYYGMVCSEFPPSFMSLESQSGMGHKFGPRKNGAWGLRNDRHHGGETMAEEIGHIILGNQGFGDRWYARGAHVKDNCGSIKPFFEDYPHSNPPGLIDANGFYNNTIYDQSRYYDFMTYAPCDESPGKGEWVSTYIYKLLFKELDNNSKSTNLKGTFSEIMCYEISGIIDKSIPDEEVQCHQLLLSDANYDYIGEGPYSIELQDGDGASLFIRYFISFDPEIVAFSETLPYFHETRKILIKYGDTVIYTLDVSVNKPQVKVLSPNGGELLKGRENIVWSASDADGDSLKFDLLYSKDGGENWEVIETELEQSNYSWNVEDYSGSDRGLIKVIATDGANSGEDISDRTFRVPKKSPYAWIYKPEGNAKIFLDRTIIFEGDGYDLDDCSLPDTAFSWSSDRDGKLGDGYNISINNLSPGVHIITLFVKDNDNNIGSDSISIQVYSMKDSDGDAIGDDVDDEPYIDNSESSDNEEETLDLDLDGIQDLSDNCPYTFNPDQIDTDGDGIGDVCESGQTNIGDDYTGNQFLIYPNPTSGYIHIRGINGSVIKLYNILGILIGTEIILDDQITVNTEDLPKGLYLIEASNENTTVVQKIIIQ